MDIAQKNDYKNAWCELLWYLGVPLVATLLTNSEVAEMTLGSDIVLTGFWVILICNFMLLSTINVLFRVLGEGLLVVVGTVIILHEKYTKNNSSNKVV